MGLFNFKTDVIDTDLVIHNDAGGTVDGIDIIFDSFQDETEAENIQKFQDWVMKSIGVQPSGIGATYEFNSGADTFTVQVRKELGNYNIEKMINLARVLKYAKDQTKLDKVLATEFLSDALNEYPDGRLVPSAGDFITRNVTTGDPIMNFVPIAEVAGTNSEVAHRELFEAYARYALDEIIPSVYFEYTLGAEFSVEVKVGTSDALNKLFMKLVTSLHASPILSWYHACLGSTVGPLGLKAVVS